MTDKEVIPVNKLMDKVSKQNKSNKKNFNSRRDRLQKILASRKLKRDGWDKEKRDNYIQFLTRLKAAHDNYITALSNKIGECAENILRKNIKTNTFKLWDPQNIKCDLKGFSEFTIYRGFWNGEKKKHDRLPHMESGIKATPIVQVSRTLRPMGYIVKDISDVNLSLHIVIEVTLEMKTDEVEGKVEDKVEDKVETKVEADVEVKVNAEINAEVNAEVNADVNNDVEDNVEDKDNDDVEVSINDSNDSNDTNDPIDET